MFLKGVMFVNYVSSVPERRNKVRILRSWQYKYIERCLYDYKRLNKQLDEGTLVDTELKVLQAIEEAVDFFSDTLHEKMMKEYYFNADVYRDEMSNNEHYKWVCEVVIHTEQPNGYVIRREIVYRVAMNCYRLQLFSK
jgi:hypothetical protein